MTFRLLGRCPTDEATPVRAILPILTPSPLPTHLPHGWFLPSSSFIRQYTCRQPHSNACPFPGSPILSPSPPFCSLPSPPPSLTLAPYQSVSPQTEDNIFTLSSRIFTAGVGLRGPHRAPGRWVRGPGGGCKSPRQSQAGGPARRT